MGNVMKIEQIPKENTPHTNEVTTANTLIAITELLFAHFEEFNQMDLEELQALSRAEARSFPVGKK